MKLGRCITRLAVWREYLAAAFRLRKSSRKGARARVIGRPRIRNRGEMILGDRFLMDCGLMRSQLSTRPGGVLQIGDDVFINFGTTISASSKVTIGDRTLIANQVTIMDHDFHGLEKRDEPGPARPIHIGNDVWICVKATVLKGVTIGDGAVVAAGAVVTGDIPPRCLAAGVPARVVREL